MHYLMHFIFKSILLTAAYAGVGYLSLLLAIPPGFATPVWPAAGIALAGVLLGGNRYLPAVFAGSIIINLHIASAAGGNLTEVVTILSAAGIAAGAALQALVGRFLIGKKVADPTELRRERDIFCVLICGGVVSSLINTIIGPAVLWLSGLLPASVLPLNMFTWWIGDAIGIILFTPLLLILASRGASSLRKIIVSVPIILFATLVIFVFVSERQEDKEEAYEDFKLQAHEIVLEFKKNRDAYIDILTANERFISASDHVSFQDFEVFTSEFFDKYPGILSLSWNKKVLREERQEYEQAMRAQGFPDFRIMERADFGKFITAHDRDVYFPVTNLYPYRLNRTAHGHDTYAPDKVTNNIRQATLNRARDEGRAITTGRISLVQAENDYGLLFYNPVYKRNVVLSSVTSKRENLIGYTAGVFVIPRMMQSAKHMLDHAGMDLIVRDKDVSEDTQVLYDTRTKDFKEPKTPLPINEEALQAKFTLNVAGHTWEMLFIQKEQQAVVAQNWSLWFILTSGLVFSGLLGTMLLIISAQTERSKKEILVEYDNNKLFIIPILSVALTLAMTTTLFLQVKKQEKQFTLERVQEEAEQVRESIASNIKTAIIAQRRMAQRWDVSSGTPKEEWNIDAINYLNDNIALTTLEWVDESYHVRWIQPLEGNEKAVNLNIAFNDDRKAALKNASKRGKVTLTPPLDLVQGYRAFICYVPVYPNNEFNGFIAGIYDIKKFLNAAVPDETKEFLNIKIKDGDKIVYRLGDDDEARLNQDYVTTQDITLFNRTWEVTIWPDNKFVTENSSYLSIIILISGLLISFLIGFAIYYAMASSHRSTQLIEKSQALRISEKQFRTAMENSAIGMALSSEDKKWLNVNRAMSDILGYETEELLQIRLKDITHPDDVYNDRELLQDIDEGKISNYQIEKRYFHKDGSVVWTLLNLSTVRDEDGDIEYYIAQVLDITERKIADQKLKDTLAFQDLVLSNIPDLIFVKDEEFRIIEANPPFLAVFPEEQRDMVLGSTMVESFNKEEADAFLANDRLAFKEGYSETEETIEFPDGRIRVLFTKKVRFINDKGHKFILGVARDITNRKAIEREREEYTEALEVARIEATRANVMKSEFLANMSHEIRTPLNGVVGAADLLKNTSISKEQEKYLNVITSSGDTLLALINDVLDLSKIEAGELSINNEPIVLKDFINDTMNLFYPRVSAKSVALDAEYDGDIPHLVMGDSVRLSQIMTNLLGNAVKFVDKGHIKIIVSGEENSKDKFNLRVSVSDTGIGIPDDKLDTIFDKFGQADATTTKKYGGTGLGLAITKKLVELMGGSISVDSKVDEGTTFTFEIPCDIVQKDASDDQVIASNKNAISQEEEDREETITAHILLVENELVNQMVATEMLERVGCTVDLAENGKEALDKLKASKGGYDIVLMDCMMPIMDGFDATIALRRREKAADDGSHQVVIAMTANAMAGEKDKCLEVGMDDYLSKPVRSEVLYAKLKEYLD